MMASNTNIGLQAVHSYFDDEADAFDDQMLHLAGSARLVFFGKEEEENDVHVLPNSCRQCRASSIHYIGRPARHTCNPETRPQVNLPRPRDNDDDVSLLDCLTNEEDCDPHCHTQYRANYSKKVRNRLIISSVLCFIFIIGEIIGGYMASSLAIVADAAHLLGDLTSFLIGLFAIWVGGKQSTRKMTFGYFRAEILGALASVILVWIMAGILFVMAVRRIVFQDYTINADIMIIISGIGVAINVIMGVVLHGMCNCHGHHHGHDHSNSRNNSHGHSHGRSENINIRAAMMHVIGDLVQSIGVLVAAYVIKYKPEYHIADPICTFIFSVLVIVTTIPVVRDSVHILLEGLPHGLNYTDIKDDLQNVAGVRMVHSLHIWSLSLDKNALIAHLAVDDTIDSYATVRAATKICQEKYQIHFSSIQVECYQPSVMLNCRQCQGPDS